MAETNDPKINQKLNCMFVKLLRVNSIVAGTQNICKLKKFQIFIYWFLFYVFFFFFVLFCVFLFFCDLLLVICFLFFVFCFFFFFFTQKTKHNVKNRFQKHIKKTNKYIGKIMCKKTKIQRKIKRKPRFHINSLLNTFIVFINCFQFSNVFVIAKL